jgi:hypothetical protein
VRPGGRGQKGTCSRDVHVNVDVVVRVRVVGRCTCSRSDSPHSRYLSRFSCTAGEFRVNWRYAYLEETVFSRYHL